MDPTLEYYLKCLENKTIESIHIWAAIPVGIITGNVVTGEQWLKSQEKKRIEPSGIQKDTIFMYKQQFKEVPFPKDDLRFLHLLDVKVVSGSTPVIKSEFAMLDVDQIAAWGMDLIE